MDWGKKVSRLGLRAGLLCVFWLSSALAGPTDFPALRPPPGASFCDDTLVAINPIPFDKFPHLRARAIAANLYARGDSVDDISPRPTRKFEAEAKIITDPMESLATRLLVIRNAKRTLDLTIYIFSSDTAGRLILNEVREAIKRGVAVRILADSVGSLSPYHTALRSLLTAQGGPVLDTDGNPTGLTGGVRVMLFNSLSKSFLATATSTLKWIANVFLPEGKKFEIPDNTSWLNHRLHDKLFIADSLYENAVALIGGRNMANHYFGLTDGHPQHQDVDILLRPGAGGVRMGEILERHFNRLFYHSGNYELKRSTVREWLGGSLQNEEELQKIGRLSPDRDLGRKLKEMEENGYLHEGFSPIEGRILTELANLKRVDALTNPDPATNPKNKVHGDSIVRWSIRSAMKADKTIDIVTPYLYLSPEEIRWLQDWVDADPSRKVRLVTNGILTMDPTIVRAMVENQVLPPLFQNGWENPRGQIEFHELGKMDSRLTGGRVDYGTLHGKMMVIDGKQALVTSSNGDLRSRWLQSELGVLFTGEKTVAEVQAAIEGLIAQSTLWGSPEWKQIQAHPSLWFRRTEIKLYQRLLKVLNLTPLL